MAAAKTLLAKGHAPETEIAMKHKGSTIAAMRGKLAPSRPSRKARRCPKRARRTAVLEPFREGRTDDSKIERYPQAHPEMIDAGTVPARGSEFVGHR